MTVIFCTPSCASLMVVMETNAHNQHILSFDQRDSSETLHRNSRMSRLVHRRSLHLLQFAFKLKMKDDLLERYPLGVEWALFFH